MTAALLGTPAGTNELRVVRDAWSRLRNSASFRGSMLTGRRGAEFLAGQPPAALTVYGHSLFGCVRTSTVDFYEFLASPDMDPEGEFFGVAADESFTVYADRAMNHFDVSVWIDTPEDS